MSGILIYTKTDLARQKLHNTALEYNSSKYRMRFLRMGMRGIKIIKVDDTLYRYENPALTLVKGMGALYTKPVIDAGYQFCASIGLSRKDVMVKIE